MINLVDSILITNRVRVVHQFNNQEIGVEFVVPSARLRKSIRDLFAPELVGLGMAPLIEGNPLSPRSFTSPEGKCRFEYSLVGTQVGWFRIESTLLPAPIYWDPTRKLRWEGANSMAHLSPQPKDQIKLLRLLNNIPELEPSHRGAIESQLLAESTPQR